MNSKLILLSGIFAVFGSCTSAYKIGQTPDDVYYSPAPSVLGYVTTNNEQDGDGYLYNNTNSGTISLNDNYYPMNQGGLYFSSGLGYPYNYSNSLFLGSSFYSPYSSFYNPFYSPFSTGFGFNSFYNNFNSFYSPFYNGFYNPVYSGLYYPTYAYYGTPVFYNSKPGNSPANYRVGPRQYNLAAYNNRTTPTQPNNGSVPVRNINTTPTNTTGVGNFFRRIFSTNNNYSTNRPVSNNRNFNNNYNNNDRPSRSFEPANSGNFNTSSSRSGGGGSAPVRTFRR